MSASQCHSLQPRASMASHTVIDVELKLHSDVQVLADEWSGISDPVIRRKLQNRLNKRASSTSEFSPCLQLNSQADIGQLGRRKAAQQKQNHADHDSEDVISERRTVARITQASGLPSLIANAVSELHPHQSTLPGPQIVRGDELALQSANEDSKSDRIAMIVER